jgi:transcriptional regulator with PAS, ATPase and Fis domain
MGILFAWLGNTDLRASDGDPLACNGPIRSALDARGFDRLELLSNYGPEKTRRYCDWLTEDYRGEITSHLVTLRGPTCFEDIYREANRLVSQARNNDPTARLCFHLSPGTPAMAAVWIVLAKSKYDAELIESSREQGVQTVQIPLNLAAEFLPSAAADSLLNRLVHGLPPDTPEFSSIVHRCPAMQRVIAMAHRLAVREIPVLIQGESGTGKELFARAIHQASPRRDAPFVAVNCGAIPNELVDAELFGHEKGAFTGATMARSGYFEAASGGTLFLDEIGELAPASQVRLLRVLQEGEITRVGATRSTLVDVRIVAATHRVLPVEVREGRFREDLLHRLAVGVLMLPPLREREGDLTLLIEALLERINREADGRPGYVEKKLSVGARNLLLRQPWPGNVRELQNILLRASIWASGAEISAADVAEALSFSVPRPAGGILGRPLAEGFSLPEVMAEVARHYLDRALAEARDNKTEAARLLGLGSYQTLTNWLNKYVTEK